MRDSNEAHALFIFQHPGKRPLAQNPGMWNQTETWNHHEIMTARQNILGQDRIRPEPENSPKKTGFLRVPQTGLTTEPLQQPVLARYKYNPT
jgi:hypothetical protein